MRIIKDINSIPRPQWEQLLQTSSTSSFFQTRECYDIYSDLPEVFTPFCIAVEENGELKGVIIGYIQKDGGRIKGWLSRRAIINGGPLLADDISAEALAAMLSECSKSLKGRTIYIETRNFEDFSRFRPVFESNGFSYVPHLNFHIDTSSEEVVDQNLGKSRKRDIRTSFREGATIVDNPSAGQVREFYDILNDLYKKKVKTALFPLSFFEYLYKQDYSRYLLVEFNGKVVGGTLCVCLPGCAVYEWFACGMDNVNKNVYPSTLATYAGICHAARNGYRYFDMMGAGAPGQEYGVRDFKAKFGGQLVEHGRYLNILNPLLYAIGKAGVKLIKRFG